MSSTDALFLALSTIRCTTRRMTMRRTRPITTQLAMMIATVSAFIPASPSQTSSAFTQSGRGISADGSVSARGRIITHDPSDRVSALAGWMCPTRTETTRPVSRCRSWTRRVRDRWSPSSGVLRDQSSASRACAARARSTSARFSSTRRRSAGAASWWAASQPRVASRSATSARAVGKSPTIRYCAIW